MRIGINGLGRIGRGFLRASLTLDDLQVVAVNDVGDRTILAHLLRHDSLFGKPGPDVIACEEGLRIGDQVIRFTHAREPGSIPWSETGVDLVLESTGRFTSRSAAAAHLERGAGRVIITSPSADADLTICYGVNENLYNPERHRVLSNASCTTNAMAAVMSVVDREIGIERAAMTTVHCYTNDQVLMDAPHRDPRRARAAGMSMIPTSTSAAGAIVRVMPQLEGRVYALAVRVPTAAVSLIDLSIILRRQTALETVRGAFRRAASGPLLGVLGYSDEELVSIDYLGDTRSAIIDGSLLAVEGERLLKTLAWYDNERGYVARLVDLVRHMACRRDGAGRNQR